MSSFSKTHHFSGSIAREITGVLYRCIHPPRRTLSGACPLMRFLFAPWTPELPQESKSVRLRMFIIFHPYSPPTLKDKNTFRNFWGGWATFFTKNGCSDPDFSISNFLVSFSTLACRTWRRHPSGMGRKLHMWKSTLEIWDCLETNFWNWWLVELSGEELVERLVEHCLIWRIQALMQLLIYLLQIWNSLLVHTVDGDPA